MSFNEESLDRAELDLEHALVRDVHSAYLEAAARAPERMIARAERAAALSAGLSTSYLALSAFQATSSDVGWVGVLPALWFGISILGYGVFISASGRREYGARPLAIALTEHNRTQRLRTFVNWINRTALRRRWALEGGAISMASGVIAMPMPLVAPEYPLLHLVALLPWLVAGGAWAVFKITRRAHKGSLDRYDTEPVICDGT